MKKLHVTIKEREKKISSFNLHNFRDEIVNFMYKKTVAGASRNNMVFYVLLFFLSIKKNNKTLLEDLLESNIQKIEALNERLSMYDKLERGQYADLVNQTKLKDVFKFDVFFVLIIAFRQHSEIKKEFELFFKENPEVLNEFDRLHSIYNKKLVIFFEKFEQNLIEDDRVGYTGEYLDLSKSVYRTIKMRSSRRIDLTLHKYAEVKSISSNSPILVEVVQSIDPEIIIHIWDAYNLDEYVRVVWRIAKDEISKNWLLQGMIAGAAYDACKWLKWKLTDGVKNRKEKRSAREDFKESLEDRRNKIKKDPIQEALAKAVMSSNEYLQSEIKALKAELKKTQKENTILVEKNKKIKELQEKIEHLENVEIDVRDI